ncbi:MAG: putative DNA binding domain-containing protein [Prevotellaceae bacterium]|jgi:ATP-dependent DNA helicase RecG|nr:putative DNA binding domain-containing protein [Prevotellaceae bacterium]
MINISDILKQGEGLTVEFKTSFNEEVIETLVAFANAKGGVVYVGVNDSGKIVGVTLGKETTQQWLNEIKSKTEPSISPDLEIIETENKMIAVLSVQEFPVKPIACKNRYFKRVQNSNHKLAVSEISDLYMQSMQYSWDSYPSQKYSFNDLDINKIAKFIDKVNSTKRFNLTGTERECLQKIRLINKDSITNAAALLFAKEGSAYNVHLGRFKTPSMIIDDRMLRQSLFEAVEETQKYLISQMKVAFEITGITTQRTEILEYPLPAVRELILNCLIHRDYLSPVDVQIKMFDNSIVFFNPGKLYGDITIEDLNTNTYHASARNKLLAEAFYLTGDIEKYGSGFKRIRDEIANYPTMQFEYAEIQNGFQTTLKYLEQKTDINLKTVEKTVEKTDTIDAKIISLMSENKNIKVSEIANAIKRGVSVTNERIAKLKTLGILQRIGADKGGYWKITQKN